MKLFGFNLKMDTSWVLLGLILLVTCALIYKYRIDSFAATSCTFIKLGDYNISPDITVKNGITEYGTKQGVIYIPPGSTSFSALQYTKSNDTTYSYISLTKKDINGLDVFGRIQQIMKCKGVPEFSNSPGINSKPALILCLQKNTGTTISRTFFIKCFVPLLNNTTNDSNTIVGEIAGNTNAVYDDIKKPIALIQKSVGTPVILPDVLPGLYDSTRAYSTNDLVTYNSKVYKMTATSSQIGIQPDTVGNTVWTLQDSTYSLSYTICPAAARPQGFEYTDCCIADDTSKITNSSWASLDLTSSTECPASATSSSSSTSTGKAQNCGTGSDDPSCPKPFCSRENKMGACTGDALERGTDGKYLDPNCKKGTYSTLWGSLVRCIGSKNTEKSSNSDYEDLYGILRNRSDSNASKRYKKFNDDEDEEEEDESSWDWLWDRKKNNNKNSEKSNDDDSDTKGTSSKLDNDTDDSGSTLNIGSKWRGGNKLKTIDKRLSKLEEEVSSIQDNSVEYEDC